MKIYVDIDETICHYDGVERLGYKNALPITSHITKINNLYDQGHEITYWTSRGSVSGIDYFEITEQQLKKWGCKYHMLSVGEKPAYDLLICDRTKRIEAV
tara:strand:+ start:990 stop:1289 length:300 start_codon:yes stop_codon:yes gene_type:complete